MIKRLQQNYNGADLNAATSGIIFFLIEENCTIKKISIKTKTNATADLTFNLNLNGIDLFSGAGRPKIQSGSKLGQLSGLNIAANEFDELILNLEAVAGGVADSPITLIVEVDDGQPSGGGSGSTYQQVSFTNKVGVSTAGNGVISKNTNADQWGDAGCFSVEKISNTGRFKLIRGVQLSSANAIMAGLSFTDSNQNYTSIAYGLNYSSNSQVYELGTGKGSTFSMLQGTETIFDVYRDEFGNRYVRYIADREVKWITAVTEGDLYFDVSFYGASATLGKVLVQLD